MASSKMEPTRLTVRTIMSPWRAAHFERWADEETRELNGLPEIGRRILAAISWNRHSASCIQRPS
jgi:hypothetical protein